MTDGSLVLQQLADSVRRLKSQVQDLQNQVLVLQQLAGTVLELKARLQQLEEKVRHLEGRMHWLEPEEPRY